jgi:O-methyltransferase involved in polyketide biosynthesis
VGDRWLDKLSAAGFDSSKPVFVAPTGVSLYLTQEGIMATLRQIAALALGSTLAMTYNLPLELADDEERPGIEMVVKGARAAGTPFVSFFTSEEIKSMACDAGFKTANHVSAAELAKRYFADRKDGFHPPKSEEFLIATK